jgi:hypoxanthine-DNA glycosylase
VINARVETLVLGSFPSAASLAAGQYYAHPRNQFWHILGAVLGERLNELAYAQRLERLLAHAIGLWDVIAVCEREGSLDAAIRNAQRNDVRRVLRRAPRLQRVLLNGQLAGRAAPWFEAAGFASVVVPSSSPAFASLSVSGKVALWRQALADGRREQLGPQPGRATR